MSKIRSFIVLLLSVMMIANAFSFKGYAQSSTSDEVLTMMNKVRSDAGLILLSKDKDLEKAAEKRAEEIASCFSHTRPDGREYYTVSEKVMAENIAKLNGYDVETIFDMWMNSKVHRTNILYKDSSKCGVGSYTDPNGCVFIAVVFD